ncbi:jerky protein homolog-like [Bombus pascuorum]|uniref:jerky protein homolog-like n=1 Tax=Bombus pascuorum TaxID=65598 RepID=UPI00298D72B4|nr:jerky protein homolog-like [Bombus pascuorum]
MTPERQLTIDKKYKIVKMKDKGMTRKTIAKKYGISLSTVNNIYVQSEEIKKQFEGNIEVIRSPRKYISWREITDLERVLYQWFIRCRGKEIKIKGADIQRKAVELNKKLNVYPHFDASTRWLQNFTVRYDITDADICRNFPAPNEAGNIFKTEFKKHLQDEECTLENVYNVVYAPIMWKAVPEEILTFHRGKSTRNQKMCEDHVTALFCANATGCHKLPVLIIGSIAETQSLYNFNTDAFSTIYTSNSNAWMDSTIFNEWFKKHFLKSIKERQEKNGRREKTVLLLDNARSLHDLKDLNKKDNFVTVMSLPSNVSQHIQPMNSGIIACFKRKYRKELVETLMPLSICNTEKELINIHKELNMWDCCRIVHDAWSYVDDAIMKNAWDKLLKFDVIRNVDAKKRKSDIFETVKLLHNLPGCKQYNKYDVSNWFEIDNIHDKVMTICTDEALQDFGNNTLDQLNISIVDDEGGPYYS